MRGVYPFRHSTQAHAARRKRLPAARTLLSPDSSVAALPQSGSRSWTWETGLVPRYGQARQGEKIPLPSWIINLLRLYRLIGLGLLVYAALAESVVIALLAIASLYFSWSALGRFERA